MSAVIATPTNAGPVALVREDLRDFAGYRSARSESVQGSIWLNANESPWPNAGDADGALRRYPDPQPQRLRAALASLYGCAPAQLLAGRGSDECIDLLVRAVCRPGGDAIVVTSPTFGMYAVSARLHGTRVIDVPLRERDGRMRLRFRSRRQRCTHPGRASRVPLLARQSQRRTVAAGRHRRTRVAP